MSASGPFLGASVLDERTPEERRSDNHAAAAARLWATPGFREKMAAIRKAAWDAGKYGAQRGHRKRGKLSRHIEVFRRLFAEGVPRSVIAERFECSYAAVWMWTRVERPRPYPRHDVSVIKVHQLRNKGLSFARIALLLECSERTVRDRFKGKAPRQRLAV